MNKMTASEAGKLGAIASLEAIRENKEKRIQKYLTSPALCKFCGNKMPYEKRHNKFCNHSCAASNNNLGIKRNSSSKRFERSANLNDKDFEELKKQLKNKKKPNCLNCTQPLPAYHRKYCSNKCQSIFDMKKSISTGNYSARTAKKFLMQENGNKCKICSNEEWQGKPIPIELDHIDGDSTNNELNNLRLLCPNCHAQTSTYKGKNVGSGRAYRRQRYREGKSY